MKSKLLSLSLLALLVHGCSGDGNSEAQGSGGSASGGAKNGGSQSTGGSGSGGKVSSGGASGNGGSVSSGGSQGSGGSAAGGSQGSGGKTGSGGGTSQPDAAAGGGGGQGGAGGSSGGQTGTDGGTAPKDAGAGGGSGTGGSQGTGGGAPPVSKSGYPAAGASGQAEPTGPGTSVTVLPWAGFKGAISFNFDDANQTQIDHYNELQALNDQGNNVRYTFYLQTGKTNEMKSTVWAQAVKDGHELGNHTKSHNSSASASDIQAAQDAIKSSFGVTAYSIAAPNGNSSYESAAKGKFLTNRTAGDNGAIGFTDNPDSRQFTLPCILPAANASTQAMTGPIDTALKAGKWSTLLIHGFTGGSDGAYNAVSVSNFVAAVKWAKDQGTLWIDTVENVSAYWVGGYRFSKLTPTTSGKDKTWTWKTADFNNPFPPGKYLRVKTDGGKLKQGDTVLAWDPHGYYEVSLDAGTLTLTGE